MLVLALSAGKRERRLFSCIVVCSVVVVELGVERVAVCK